MLCRHRVQKQSTHLGDWWRFGVETMDFSKFAFCLFLYGVILQACLGADDNADFDFFYFVRQWPEGVCEHTHCRREPDDGIFTVHGLWPNRFDGSWPQYCDKSDKFDEKAVQDFVSELRKEWPSYFGKDASFWKHEWEKHGTCAKPYINNEREYFGTVLQMKDDYDLLEALKASGIFPSWRRAYSVYDIEQAIKKYAGGRPIVHCKGRTPGDVTEIWMCFDVNFKPFDCKRRSSSSCQSVRLPPNKSFSATQKLLVKIAIAGIVAVVVFYFGGVYWRKKRQANYTPLA